MSKISYCSLEEAWGKQDNNTNIIKKPDDDLEKIHEKIQDNINKVERNSVPENNSMVEYNRYRFNPSNKVISNDIKQDYSPFNESLEKKYLRDKLFFLEHEFRKYKDIFDKSNNDQSLVYNNYPEHFTNSEESSEKVYKKSNNSNDMIDLILLIIIGLIIILVMNSIFNLGKTIGSRNNNI